MSTTCTSPSAQAQYDALEAELNKAPHQIWLSFACGFAAFLAFLEEDELTEKVIAHGRHKQATCGNTGWHPFGLQLVNNPAFGLEDGLRSSPGRRELSQRLAGWFEGKKTPPMPSTGKAWGEIINDDDITWGQLVLMSDKSRENQAYAHARKALYYLGALLIEPRNNIAHAANVLIQVIMARGGNPDGTKRSKKAQCEHFRPFLTPMVNAFLAT